MNCHIRAMQIFILLFVMNVTVFLFGGNMKKKKIGLFLMIIGIILILIAALLVGYNIKSDRKAEIKSEKVMEILKTEYKLPKLLYAYCPKSQGMKQLMSGLGLILLAIVLVPVLETMMTGAI